MSATPRPHEDDEDRGRKRKPDERTRGERIKASAAKAEHKYLEPPVDLGPFGFIADYLFEVGPTTGDQPVTWSELRNWAQAVGIEPDEFTAGAIVALSREFLAALGQARDPMCRLADLLEESTDE